MNAQPEQPVPPKRRRLPRWLRWSLDIALIVGVFLIVRAWMSPAVSEGPAPPLSGLDLQGAPVSLSEYRGAPLLVVFWAEWCRICRLEMPMIRRVAEDWPVLTVAMQSGDQGTVRRFVAESGWEDLRVLNDPDASQARQWGVKGVPVMYVLDGAGQIRFVETGLTTSWGLRARLWWAARHSSAE
ncbi:MAG: protein disulfide oxidoreductase [Halothiobacillaceae bacterium]